MASTEKELDEATWDCCVIGNGVSALWLSHWLWSSKKSVIWITSEEPYGSERAMLQHGWLWGMPEARARELTRELQGFDAGESLAPFGIQYYDARSARRFRRWGEAKQEWGTHEKDYFTRIGTSVESPSLDLWSWHRRLHAFHDSGDATGPTQVELFREPRFVRVQGWPLVELKAEKDRLTSAVIAGPGAPAAGAGTSKRSLARSASLAEIRAEKFYLGDFDEHLPSLSQNEEASRQLAAALKGKSYEAGFGLRFWHRDTGLQTPESICVVPLVVNPGDKDESSHVAGRFRRAENGGSGFQSLWVGLLTEAEVEDNNEILKKIKQAKRAIDRAIPGFIEGIEREAVTFEPRMFTQSLVKKRVTSALGAALFSDQDGPEGSFEGILRAVGRPESTADSSSVASDDRSTAKCPPIAE